MSKQTTPRQRRGRRPDDQRFLTAVNSSRLPLWALLIIGGVLFDGIGYQTTFVASAVLLVAAAILAFLTSRAQAPLAA